MKASYFVLIGVLLLSMAAPSFAAEAAGNVSKLTVQGEGIVSVAPDMAKIVLGVETRNESAADAIRENAQLMNQTINALLEAGINESEIQTSTFSLTTLPEIEPEDEPEDIDATPRAPIFLATNQVTVRLNNTEDVGAVLDAAVSAGSNSIQEVSFDLKDSAPQEERALEMAIDDAQRKAQVAADAAGVELGRIMEITEGYGYVMEAAKSYSADFYATPIQPGQMDVSASVTVVYEIA